MGETSVHPVILRGQDLRYARDVLHWWEYRPTIEGLNHRPGASARDGRESDVNYLINLLDHIGWPKSPLRAVEVPQDDLPVIRRAAYEDLKDHAERVYRGAALGLSGGRWDHEHAGSLKRMKAIARLLDAIGWNER